MSEGNFFQKMSNFDHMITPSLIKIIYIIFCILSILAGLSTLFTGGSARWSGLVLILLGPLVARVYCELVIVAFKINENLQAIVKQQNDAV